MSKVLHYKKTGKLVNQKFREFFLPTVLASMAAQLGTIVNGIIVGNLISSHAMAAISACLPLGQITYAISVLISIGSAGLIAIAAGKRDSDSANFIFNTVITIGIFAGIVWAIFLIPNSQNLSNFLSSAEDLRSLMNEYLKIFVWRLPLYLMFFSWQTLMRTDGFAKIVSRGILIGQVLNVLLSFLLVSNGFGVEGAGIALICSDLTGMAYMLRKYFFSSERTREFAFVLKDVGKFFNQVVDIIKSGVPAACSVGLISVKVWAIYQILGETGGADAMTLYALCMACLSVVSMCIAGCNGAMMPLVGMLFGEKDFVGIRILVQYVLKFALTLSGIFSIFTFVFPQIILLIYNVPPSMAEAGKISLRLFSFSLVGVTMTFLVMYYYSTIQQRFAANILSWTEGILVVVPAAWVLSKNFGLNGVWSAFFLAEVAGFFVIWIYCKYVFKKSHGKLSDIFLIETTEPNLIYDVSVRVNVEDAVKISSEAMKILCENNFEKNLANRVGLALEEMLVNIEEINADKKIDVDLRIKTADEKIIIAIRDNGKSFNPLEYQPQEDLKIDNIMVLKSITKNIHYSRTLALNQTVIEV